MASVEFRQVTKMFGGFTAVDKVDLEIGDGEFVCLLGPSGCGKTTSLRMIAGLETPTQGQVIIAGRDVTGVPPRDRQISMVFQDYALYPHMTLIDYIAYPLKVRESRQTSGMPAPAKSPARCASVNCSTACLRRSQAGSSSVHRWHAPSSTHRRSTFSTSRSPTSTPSCACRRAASSITCSATWA
jgi:ABC-type sugar transport system ATPase subunit